MAEHLNGAWEVLNAVALVQQRLGGLRPFIWQRAQLATAEHTQIVRAQFHDGKWRPSENGDYVAIEISIEARFRDGRFVTSYLEILARSNEWLVHPYIAFTDRAEQVLWDGPTSRPRDLPGFLEAVDAAANNLVNATVRLDFEKLRQSVPTA